MELDSTSSSTETRRDGTVSISTVSSRVECVVRRTAEFSQIDYYSRNCVKVRRSCHIGICQYSDRVP